MVTCCISYIPLYHGNCSYCLIRPLSRRTTTSKQVEDHRRTTFNTKHFLMSAEYCRNCNFTSAEFKKPNLRVHQYELFGFIIYQKLKLISSQMTTDGPVGHQTTAQSDILCSLIPLTSELGFCKNPYPYGLWQKGLLHHILCIGHCMVQAPDNAVLFTHKSLHDQMVLTSVSLNLRH